MISHEPPGGDATSERTDVMVTASNPRRLLWVLTLVPGIVLLVSLVIYLAARPFVTDTIAIHVGPDGFGFGSLQTTALVSLTVALATLAFGTRYTLNRLRIGYWYMAEKTTATAFISIGYASIAALLALLIGVWGRGSPADQESAFTGSILVFALSLMASMGVHAMLLPPTRNFETP